MGSCEGWNVDEASCRGMFGLPTKNRVRQCADQRLQGVMMRLKRVRSVMPEARRVAADGCALIYRMTDVTQPKSPPQSIPAGKVKCGNDCGAGRLGRFPPHPKEESL